MFDEISVASSDPLKASDDCLFDAYSQAVIGAVDQAGPAVVHIAVTKNGTQSGVGSGLVIASDGLIITNSHVVNGTTSVTVSMADGQRAVARVLGDDPHTDIAVLRTDEHLRFQETPCRAVGDCAWQSPWVRTNCYRRRGECDWPFVAVDDRPTY
jgi:S1-C subfamily serine protease